MLYLRSYTRYLLLLIFVLITIVTIFICTYNISGDNDEKRQSYEPLPMKIVNGSQCYKRPKNVNNNNYSEQQHSNQSSIRYLEDVLDSKMQPTSGKTIFFHETTCSTTGILTLNAKQACAIESAARQNPNHDIFVLFASPVGLRDDIESPFLNKLRNFTNIHWRNVDLWRYSENTDMFDWLSSNQLFDSSYLFEHMSDIVRALSLYRYGGYHVDLDVIVLKNLDELGENFVGDDWATVVNGAIIHLHNHGIGKKVLHLFFKEVIDGFNGSSFIANGPSMLTRACEQICGDTDRTLWTRDKCHGMTLHPKETFYPISWSDFMLYFDPDKLMEAIELTKTSSIIHVWNDRSKTIWNKIGTKNAYQVIAEQKCPSIYKASEYF